MATPVSGTLFQIKKLSLLAWEEITTLFFYRFAVEVVIEIGIMFSSRTRKAIVMVN